MVEKKHQKTNACIAHCMTLPLFCHIPSVTKHFLTSTTCKAPPGHGLQKTRSFGPSRRPSISPWAVIPGGEVVDFGCPSLKNWDFACWMLGKSKNIFCQMVVKNGDWPWHEVKNHLKHIQEPLPNQSSQFLTRVGWLRPASLHWWKIWVQVIKLGISFTTFRNKQSKHLHKTNT